MAESRRSKTRAGASSEEAAQNRRDRITLLIFLVGGIVIVAGMWLLATFLSGA